MQETPKQVFKLLKDLETKTGNVFPVVLGRVL